MLYHPQSEYYAQFLTNKLRKLTPVDAPDAIAHTTGADAASDASKAKTADTKAWISWFIYNWQNTP